MPSAAKVLPAGKLRHQVLVQENQPAATNGFNEPVDNWVTVRTSWASIEPIGGREIWLGQQVQPDSTHGIRMRWSPTVEINPKHRLIYQSRVFEIEQVTDVEERNREWAIQCKEQPTNATVGILEEPSVGLLDEMGLPLFQE